MTDPHRSPFPDTPAVAARSLYKRYGRADTTVTALRDVSVDFDTGKFTAIMGPSGSGKSTLMHCLAGLDTVDSGQVYIGTTELTGLNDTQLTLLRRERIGFIFQAFNLVPTLTAEQNITLPVTLAGGSVDRAALSRITHTLGLTDRLQHRPSELSGGQQQRVATARALLRQPAVIFADEPTGNLDSRSGAEVLSLMRSSREQLGQSIIMVTHDPVAASYADRVVLLKDGSLEGEISAPTTDSVIAALASLGA